MKLYPWSFVCGMYLISAGLTQSANAAILAEYTFPGSSTYVSSDTDLNSAASNFTSSGMSGGWGRSSANSTETNYNTIFTRGNVLQDTEAEAVSEADYYTFTLTPSAGYAANLSTLTFLTNSTAGGTQADQYSTTLFIRSSLDNFSSNIATITDGPATDSTSDYHNQSLSLTGSQFQNITEPITFRIYLYQTGPEALNIEAIFRSDTYVLNGTMVPIPEPSLISLIGVGAGLLFLSKRRRRCSIV